jgi:N-acetylglucosaminyl-diphospho-decaprenol L-rhamnosyltransferase
MSSTPHLAIVIVTWNVRALAVACLCSVFDDLEHSDFDGVVWVVDNASSDGTAAAVREAFPAAHVLEPGENLGFAGGNNLALRAMGFPDGHDLPEYVLLLNPDTVVQPGALRALVEGMQSTGAGLGGAQLSYGDGSFQHSAFDFPGLAQLVIDLFALPGRIAESRINGRYPRAWYARGEPFDVGHPLGATFTLCREAIRQTGLFDEQFHLYCEEIDWAMRIHDAGWRVVCIPAARVVHYAAQSTSQVRPQSVIGLWTARFQLYRKHYGSLKRIAAVWIVRAGMNRLIQRTARDSSQSEEARKALVDAYREVIRRSRQA